MFDTLKYHNTDETLDLDEGISTTEKITYWQLIGKIFKIGRR